jgi:phospholipid/cholesterol/gamma-HCH transport system ATP-binding protein
MMGELIRVDHLSVRYDGRLVLDDVSASFRDDEITMVLGASGSGKTTLIKHILGLEPVDQGRIRFFGNDVASLSQKQFEGILKRLGMLFQQGALLNSLSVADNIRIPLEQHTDLPDRLIDSMVRTRLRLVGLSGYGGVLPSQLSGGMRKRAALARAIALDPEILFCDEPTSGLDPITAREMDRLLLRLRDQLGITMIIISHDVESVRRIADKVLFLHEGRLIFSGPKEEMLRAGIPELEEFFSSGPGKHAGLNEG